MFNVLNHFIFRNTRFRRHCAQRNSEAKVGTYTEVKVSIGKVKIVGLNLNISQRVERFTLNLTSTKGYSEYNQTITENLFHKRYFEVRCNPIMFWPHVKFQFSFVLPQEI